MVTQVASDRLGRTLSESQMTSIRAVMHLFTEDDVAFGVTPKLRRYCDACESGRPAAGFIEYGRYSFCNDCATTYEIARARGITTGAGQYVRDRRFGETGKYAFDEVSSA